MEPVRTCVGCRQRASRSQLLRVIDQQFLLIADSSKSLPGRGAWLHENAECLAKAIDRKAFGRALRVIGSLDASDLIKHIEQAETMLAKNE
ncbi:MAG: YlxR family protein [Microbacteriaceae bacterium]